MVGGSCQCPECGQFLLADFTLALVETPQQLTPAAGEPPAHGCMAPPPTLPQGFPGDAQWLGPVSTSEVVSKSAPSKRQWWRQRKSSWYPSMEGAAASSSNSNSWRRGRERSRSKPPRTSDDKVPSTPKPRSDSDSGNHPGWSRQCADLRPRFAKVAIRTLKECKQIVRSCHRGTNMRVTKQKCQVCGLDTCQQYEAARHRVQKMLGCVPERRT